MIYADDNGHWYDEGHLLISPEDIALFTPARSGRLSRGLDETEVRVILDKCAEDIGRLMSGYLAKSDEAERYRSLVKDVGGRHVQEAAERQMVDMLQRTQQNCDEQYAATQTWCTLAMADTRRRNNGAVADTQRHTEELIAEAEQQARQIVEEAGRRGAEAAMRAVDSAPTAETTSPQELARLLAARIADAAMYQERAAAFRAFLRTLASTAVQRGQDVLSGLDAYEHAEQEALADLADADKAAVVAAATTAKATGTPVTATQTPPATPAGGNTR